MAFDQLERKEQINGLICNPLGRRKYMISLVFLALASLIPASFLSLWPNSQDGETLGVIVIGQPRDAAVNAVASAGGEILRDGVLPGSVVARSTGAAFLARLRGQSSVFFYHMEAGPNCAALR